MKKKILILLALTAVLLTGCKAGNKSSEMKTDNNLIYVTREHTVASALVYTSEKENADYNQEELQSEVEAVVAEYNAAQGAASAASNSEGAELLPVSLRSCSLEGTSGKLVFDYATAEDFVEFATATSDDTHTITRMVADSAAQAEANGMLAGAALVKPDKTAVSPSEVAGQADLSVVVVDGAATVQTEGAIVYVSEDAELLNEFTAKLSEGTHYIIFK